MKDRIKWLDILKFIGIFEIYLGHFGTQAGRASDFVFTHHVALFFLISGCTENLNTENNFIRYAIKKVKAILVPCFFFACVTIVIDVIQGGHGWGYVLGMFQLVARGLVRNTFGNASLWFLTCLFSIQIMFFVIKQIKYKLPIFAVCLGLYFTATELFPVNPMYAPSWFFNVDSALFYMLYYAIGYLMYPYIVQLFALDSVKKKVIFGVSGGVALAYTMGLYFGKDFLSNFSYPSIAYKFIPIFVTCVMIWALFFVAKLFEDVEALAEIGKNTLYLCGSEFIVKNLVVNLVTLIGFPVLVLFPLQTYLYVGFLLFATNRYLVPVEKFILKKIVR